ncbi:MAG: GGDEF domain-containing protein [Acidobacteriia bacterium]|nr:GGDEF domain-containing protein [Terriglobia bacterium]
MISIRESVAELERCHRLREATLECYVAAIRNVAFYAIELEEDVTARHRKYLEEMAAEVAGGKEESLAESRSSFRALLREYRNKASAFISGLREDLSESARALEEIMSTLAESEGDHEGQIRGALARLREISGSPGCAPVRGALLSVAETIQAGVDEIRKQHQLTVSQFQVEIQMLHKRIDGLESAAMLDSLSKFFNRPEMEERIRAAGEWFTLVLLRVSGFQTAARQFDPAVAAELAGAFARRLHNSLPADAVIGRWSEEQFVAKTALSKPEAMSAARWISENLSGSYACLRQGKTVRPALQVNVTVLDRNAGEPPDKILAHIASFFGV